MSAEEATVAVFACSVAEPSVNTETDHYLDSEQNIVNL